MLEITKEKIEELSKSDMKLKLLKLILECNDNISFNEHRPNLNIHTGFVGDTIFEMILNHPIVGEVKINGKNLI